MVIHNEALGDFETYYIKNKNLIFHVLKRYKAIMEAKSLSMDDMTSIGTIGFIKGYEKFNPEFGTKFSTYGVPMIEGEIRRFLRDHNDGIKVSRSVKEIMRQIIQNDLEGQEPEYIAKELEVSVENVKLAIEYKGMSSLNDFAYGDDDQVELQETLVDKSSDFIDTGFVELQMIIKDVLTEREFECFRYRYIDELPQREVGERLGVSQVQASRLLGKIKEKLKIHIYGNGEPEVIKEENIIKPIEEEFEEDMAGKNFGKYNIEEAKRLIRETDLNYTQIAEETGVPYATVAYHGLKIRGKKNTDNKNSKVITRKMTDADKKRAFVKDEKKPSAVEATFENVKTGEKFVEKVNIPATDVAKPIEEVIVEQKVAEVHNVVKETVKAVDEMAIQEAPPVAKSNHDKLFSLNIEGLSAENAQSEINDIIKALKLLKVSEINISITAS